MTSRLKKILVATTLNETSDHVVRAGHSLAKLTGADLHLLHAYALPAIYYGSPMGMATVHPYAMEGEEAHMVERLVLQLERVGLSLEDVADRTIEVGSPHRLLVEKAEELGVDLILLGASESHGPLSPLLGSTADRVLRQAHVPVWVVRAAAALPPRRVLAPIDLSELSCESLRRGLELLGQVAPERPTLAALFVLSSLERKGSTQFTPEQVERFAHEELERAAEKLHRDTGWRAEPELRTGMPRHEIMVALEAEPADLVLIGTHGRSGFERLLMGSVAADVVRNAPTSVLVVPPALAKVEAEESRRVAEASLHHAPAS